MRISLALTAAACTLLLVAAALPSAHAASPLRACRDIAFTPNSDAVAASIRARGVSCADARAFIRSADGRPGARHRGHRCVATTIDAPGALPSVRYRCTQGSRTIRWVRF